jgi:hypothetical protein
MPWPTRKWPFCLCKKVTVHGPGRAPRPATLPRKTLTVPTPSNRQRCGEGLREGKPARWLSPAPPARERLRKKTPRSAITVPSGMRPSWRDLKRVIGH